ncbi:hypothetical protein LL912_19155 [Niabella sp. CC-SYL272]|uniref:hypothetical protein n=1 Tax=Niabella agricola TaxID=2891571 RepID=UPI001F3FE3B3|nr:hypothetical protein [Niabella agricola]MCF3110912.1 hypothetical protein [Niabella agricola]
MLKRLSTITAIAFITITSYGQEAKKEGEAVKTKMDAFASKTGSIIRFVDYRLPSFKTDDAIPETRIRKISSGSLNGYFYQIKKYDSYGGTTASIEYSDLLELLRAVKALKVEVSNDIGADPDYMENKFVTDDGLQVGYYIRKGKATWYIKLEKYGSDNTLFINNADVIETAFIEAKNKIDELKKETLKQ